MNLPDDWEWSAFSPRRPPRGSAFCRPAAVEEAVHARQSTNTAMRKVRGNLLRLHGRACQRRRELGIAVTEYLIVIGIVLLACIPLIVYFGPRIREASTGSGPGIGGGTAAVIAVLGGLVSTLAWAAKRAVRALERRYYLFILEELSKGTPLSSPELREVVLKRNAFFLYRAFPSVHIDALATLLYDGKIQLESGKYVMPAPKGAGQVARSDSKASDDSD